MAKPYPNSAGRAKSVDVSSPYSAECWTNSQPFLYLSLCVGYNFHLGHLITVSHDYMFSSIHFHFILITNLLNICCRLWWRQRTSLSFPATVWLWPRVSTLWQRWSTFSGKALMRCSSTIPTGLIFSNKKLKLFFSGQNIFSITNLSRQWIKYFFFNTTVTAKSSQFNVAVLKFSLFSSKFPFRRSYLICYPAPRTSI